MDANDCKPINGTERKIQFDNTKLSSTKSTAFGNCFRYFILILGWLCLTSISSNMIALNFTLICMSPPANSISTSTNGSSSTSSKEINNNAPIFEYSNRDKAFLMWSVAIGSMIGTLPFSFLYSRYGARYVFFCAGILSALATVLIPWASMVGLPYFLVLRFIQGITYAADFAAMGVICSRWASLKQNALFISVLTCYSPLSSTITNPISGVICESRLGWPMVFYSHAVFCAIVFCLWLYFYDDHPQHSQFVSDVELEKIHRDKSIAHINMERFIPYKAILSTKIVWVVWLNAFADIFSGMFLLMYQPTYFKYVLNYSIEETGFIGALPTLSHMPLKFIFGYCSDKFRCVSEKYKMIIFNTIAVALPGIGYAIVGFVPADNPTYVVIIFTCILMFFASGGGGFYKCATLCGRQYSHFVIANIQFVKCITMFLAPTMMNIFVTNENDQSQWRIIFFLLAVMLILANILFCYEVSDQPAKFTLITYDSYNQQRTEKEYKKKMKQFNVCKNEENVQFL